MRSRILKAMLLAAMIAVAAAVVTMFAVVRVPERVDIVYAATNVDLDQCANLTTPCSWQNGNLNGNNSAYSEGDVVPFRLAIEGLDAGSHTIHINYDFTSGGNKAYDFLATYDASESVDLCAVGGGAVSSFCPSLPSASTMAFPADSFVADGLPVSGAETFSGVSRDLTIFGGTITGITEPAHDGSLTGNSTGDIVVTFTSSGSAVLLVWGGHIAQSGYWDVAGGGSADGASLVSGAPWHMRTQQLDGGGNSNQDRSIQPSAIVEAPTPTPTSTPVTPTATPVTPTATPVTPTATPVTPTATPVTPTATPVTPTATPVTPTATPVPPTATPTSTPFSEVSPTIVMPSPTPPKEKGDVNCDGSVTIEDAQLIGQLLLGFISELPCPDQADVNKDGRTSINDAQLISQLVLGTIPDFGY